MITVTEPVSAQDDLSLTDEEREELENTALPSGAISYRNQDYDVRGLVDRLNRGDILIPRIGSDARDLEAAPFQRGFVWTKKQMDLFIESLLLEYPIPGFFFVLQKTDKRLIVLDGQQRLETLRRFYSGLTGERKFKLSLSNSAYDGLSYDTLTDRMRRTIDNTYISSTIISVDGTVNSYEAVYDVFARLNSSGTQLTPHEIRMALYNGELMTTIDRLNHLDNWRNLYGSDQVNKRFRDHELILRILALYLNEPDYSKPLSGFLNRFASAHRNGASPELAEACETFESAVAILAQSGVERPFSFPEKNQLNTARADSIVVAAMHAVVQSGAGTFTATVIEGWLNMLNSRSDYHEATTKATSDEVQVHMRMKVAMEALMDISA